jgi:hypothetical protein
VLLLNCSSASTEVPDEIAAGRKPSSAGVKTTSKQVASAIPKEPTTVEAAVEQRTSEQVPTKALSVEHVALEERQVPKPRQEAPEQSVATPRTQEGGLLDATPQGKGLVVVSRPESSK